MLQFWRRFKNPTAMKKLILTYGIIGGLISAAWCSISVRTFPDSVSLDTRTCLGYASMIVAFSMIFVAVKKYRDNLGGGQITFGKALKIGLLITLVASTLYVITWLISYYFFFPNFFEKYMLLLKLQRQAEGKSPAEISQEIAGMAKFKAMYKDPLFNILITYTEIAPVGIVISLIAAFLLKKNTKLTATNA
jgi:hypothetical protein